MNTRRAMQYCALNHATQFPGQAVILLSLYGELIALRCVPLGSVQKASALAELRTEASYLNKL